MKLPGFVIALVEPIFVEGEPFDVSLRKAGHLVLAAMASICSVAVIISIAIPFMDPYNHGWTAFRITWVALTAQCIVQYVLVNYTFMRLTRTCPVWLADITLVGAVATILMLTIAHPQGDMRCMMIIASMMGGMMSTPRLPFHIVLQLLVYYFSYFRDSWGEQMPFLVFSFDRPYGTLFEKSFQMAATSWAVLIGVAGIHIIVRGYIERNEQQRLARKLTLDVSKSLVIYDIDAVENTVQQNEGLVDSELLQSFTDIKENLKAFRPHIPQYLIELAMDHTSSSAEDVPKIEDDDTEGDWSMSSSFTASPHNRSRKSSTTTSLTNSPRQAALQSAPQPAPHAPRQGVNDRIDAFSGQVTTAFVDLGVKSVSSGFSQVAAAIDTINEIAHETKASIHTIQGDAIYASWNATRRTANHGRYGCLFATRLREALAEYQCLHVSGSIVQSVCQTVFAGTKQSHFLLMGEGLKQHRLQRELGASLNTFVVNQLVATDAQTWGFFAGFAKNDAGQMLYDLIGPKPDHDDDEWMYQLNSVTDPWEPVTMAAMTLKSRTSNAAPVDIEKELAPEVRARPSVEYLLKTLGVSE